MDETCDAFVPILTEMGYTITTIIGEKQDAQYCVYYQHTANSSVPHPTLLYKDLPWNKAYCSSMTVLYATLVTLTEDTFYGNIFIYDVNGVDVSLTLMDQVNVLTPNARVFDDEWIAEYEGAIAADVVNDGEGDADDGKGDVDGEGDEDLWATGVIPEEEDLTVELSDEET